MEDREYLLTRWLRDLAEITDAWSPDAYLQAAARIEALERELAAVTAERDELKETLAFVERWANHHARKPAIGAAQALATIQWHPAIRAITESYADGVIPDVPDPYAERDAARAEVEEQARVNGMGMQREARLIAERDALRKDAERYAALRQKFDGCAAELWFLHDDGNVEDCIVIHQKPNMGADLDAALDEVIASQAPGASEGSSGQT